MITMFSIKKKNTAQRIYFCLTTGTLKFLKNVVLYIGRINALIVEINQGLFVEHNNKTECTDLAARAPARFPE